MKTASGFLGLVVERELLKDGLNTNNLYSEMKQFGWVVGVWMYLKLLLSNGSSGCFLIDILPAVRVTARCEVGCRSGNDAMSCLLEAGDWPIRHCI